MRTETNSQHEVPALPRNPCAAATLPIRCSPYRRKMAEPRCLLFRATRGQGNYGNTTERQLPRETSKEKSRARRPRAAASLLQIEAIALRCDRAANKQLVSNDSDDGDRSSAGVALRSRRPVCPVAHLAGAGVGSELPNRI